MLPRRTVLSGSLASILVLDHMPRLLAQANGAGDPAATGDPRLLTNPLLAEVARNAPDKLGNFLHELDGLSSPRGSATAAAHPQMTRGIVPAPTPDELTAIRTNPDIKRAFQLNPDPMLKLLRRMMEASRKGGQS
jgi:hypothetical protein